MSSVVISASKAERALLEIIAEGKSISQLAVEQRAGLANGALNYQHKLYADIKHKILNAKISSNNSLRVDGNDLIHLDKEKNLKEKYRIERNKLREMLRVSEGERLELQYQLYHLQKYLITLEESCSVETNVLRTTKF
ncbi:hypothetical protein [Shewanella donghaensis]|uniref:hypothetical protein n=1 Tax=Shewanella donghaensis TaxID=238836 RepID=UPI0011843FBD|nr:hypothetical protein [Shewanella donghaensis]